MESLQSLHLLLLPPLTDVTMTLIENRFYDTILSSCQQAESLSFLISKLSHDPPDLSKFSDVKSYIHMCLFLPRHPSFSSSFTLIMRAKLLISWTATILINWGHRWTVRIYTVSHHPHQLFQGSHTYLHINSSLRSTKKPNIFPFPSELDSLMSAHLNLLLKNSLLLPSQQHQHNTCIM